MKIKYSISLLCSFLILQYANSQKNENPFNNSKKKTAQKEKPNFNYTVVKNKNVGYINYTLNRFNTIENLLVFVEPTTGLPILIKNIKKAGIETNEAENPENIVLNFIKKHQSHFMIKNAKSEFVLANQTMDKYHINHLRYNRKINDITIEGGEIIAHLKNNRIQTINGILFPSPDIKAPTLSAQQAVKNAYKTIENSHWENKAGHNHFKIGKKDTKAELTYFANKNGQLQLAYKVFAYPSLLKHWIIYVDAANGNIIKKINTVCSIDGPKTGGGTDLNNKSKTVNSYLIGSTYYLIDASKSMFNKSSSSLPNNPAGAIWTLDANNTNGSTIRNITHNSNNYPNTLAANKAVSAHTNAGLAFDYYKNTHNRNAINGSGGSIISIINVTKDGKQMDNAYWNGEAMFYGNGLSAFKPLAGALDVAGHEMTHGVVGSTAKLIYDGQSGAINESMADVFGAMMDRDDWKLGEDVVKTTVFKSGALRDLSNPHNGGSNLNHNGYQPAKMSEYYSGSNDNHGVHINSGIPNHAFYKIASAIGKNKSEKIYYQALTNYLTSKSNFLDLRYSITKAAEDIHGANSNEVKEVKKGFDFVEIFDPNEQKGGGAGTTVKNGEINLPTNPGTESIIVVNTAVSADKIYKSNSAGTNVLAISQTDINKRVSITDNGSFLVFIGKDQKMYKIDLKTNVQTILSSQAIWDNIAISKDGKRLAVVSQDIDTAIWIYNFEKSKWHKIMLYNPTYTKGVDAGGVEYADAIEWDYSGQYVLYDAKNTIKNQFGADIEYWDVGLVKAWDLKTNAIGDGKIEKLYSQLPKDISIGNPTFASNSGHIIAFDYIDEANNNYYIRANNTATNKTGTIYQNTVISLPSYSINDNKLLFNAENLSNDPVVALITLKTNKIEAAANPSILFSKAKWGVWYANGTRKLLSAQKDMITFSLPTIKDASQTTINGNIISIQVPFGEDLSNIAPLFTHSERSSTYIGNTEQLSGVNKNDFRNSVQYKIIAEDKSEKIWTVNIDRLTELTQIKDKIITIAPQPVNNVLNIKIYNNTPYNIFNILGSNVLKGNILNNRIPVGQLKSGIYFIEINHQRIKFIKN